MASDNINEKTILDILLIDNNSVELENNSSLLRMHRHSVTSAKSINYALEVLTIQCFDLVLINMDMAELTNFNKALKTVYELSGPKQNYPVVGLSDTRDPSDVKKCFALGMSNFILKPLDSNKLMATISLLNFKHFRDHELQDKQKITKNSD